MRKLFVLPFLLVLIACDKSPQQIADETQTKAENAVKEKAHEEIESAKKKISDLATQKMTDAQNYVNELKKTGSLSDAGKKFIADTMKLKDGMAAATASTPIEEAIQQKSKDLPWIKEQLEQAVNNNSGQAKAAWKILLDRVNEAMKK